MDSPVVFAVNASLLFVGAVLVTVIFHELLGHGVTSQLLGGKIYRIQITLGAPMYVGISYEPCFPQWKDSLTSAAGPFASACLAVLAYWLGSHAAGTYATLFCGYVFAIAAYSFGFALILGGFGKKGQLGRGDVPNAMRVLPWPALWKKLSLLTGIAVWGCAWYGSSEMFRCACEPLKQWPWFVCILLILGVPLVFWTVIDQTGKKLLWGGRWSRRPWITLLIVVAVLTFLYLPSSLLFAPAVAAGPGTDSGNLIPWIVGGAAFLLLALAGRGLDVRQKPKYPIREYERGTELYPDEAQRWLALGQALLDQGEHRKAADALRQAVELERSGETLERLGAACLLNGDVDNARENLEEAALKLRSTRALYSLGRLHEQTGESEKAHEYYQEFIDRTGQRIGIPEFDQEYLDAKSRLAKLQRHAHSIS